MDRKSHRSGICRFPGRDPDQDGFSNLEEFNAKTDPNDAKSVPSLIAKLMYVKDESLGWVIRPGYGDGREVSRSTTRIPKVQIEQDRCGRHDRTRTGCSSPKAPMTNRFKLLGSEVRKEMNKRIKIEMEVTIRPDRGPASEQKGHDLRDSRRHSPKSA